MINKLYVSLMAAGLMIHVVEFMQLVEGVRYVYA